MKVKGYIFSGLALVALLMLSVAMLSAAAAERAANSRKMSVIQAQYLAEGMIELSRGIILEQLVQKRLTAIYMFDSMEEDAAKIPIESTALYEGDADIDFSEACASVMEIISADGAVDIDCRVEVVNKTPYELKLHVLDADGSLPALDEYGTGLLLPVEYRVNVRYASVMLESTFVISGLEYYLIDDDGQGVMTVGVSTGNAEIMTTSFQYAGG